MKTIKQLVNISYKAMLTHRKQIRDEQQREAEKVTLRLDALKTNVEGFPADIVEAIPYTIDDGGMFNPPLPDFVREDNERFRGGRSRSR